MDNTLFDQYGRHDLSTHVPTFSSPKNTEFPPLSQQPVGEGCSMPTSNPVDQLVLEKCTSAPVEKQDEVKEVVKECKHIIPQTKEIILNGIKQVRHAMAMVLELKLLLTYEVVNIPQSQVLNVEGWPAPVQQKMLSQIVSRTMNTANRLVVQLSMEETVANDIELTLGDVRKNCIVMMRQLFGWLKNLRTQECLQTVILERWTNCKIIIKEICNKDDGAGESITNVNLKVYEDRLEKLEYAICCLAGPAYGTCKTVPPFPPCPPNDVTWAPGGDKSDVTWAPRGNESYHPNYSYGSGLEAESETQGPQLEGNVWPDSNTYHPNYSYGSDLEAESETQDPHLEGNTWPDPNTNQGELQGQTNENREIQDIVSSFQYLKAALAEEMGKALQLTQKLQQNLQCMAEARKKL